MTTEPTQEITELLVAWNNGDRNALERLTLIIYDQLYHLAKYYLSKERREHPLQPTELVNEVYLRLLHGQRIGSENRAHFLRAIGGIMRHILTDMARAICAQKRGNRAQQVELDEAMLVSGNKGVELVALDEAITSLAAIAPRQCQVVELRFFVGLSIEETAEVLGIAPATVWNDWCAARAWLYCELHGGSVNVA